MAKRGIRGAAARVKRAPAHCKTQLSHCMRGSGGRSKARRCMVQFNRCFR